MSIAPFLLAAALAAEPAPARDPPRPAHLGATPPPDSASGDPPKPPDRPPPGKDRAREDPDAEILSHLELLERMELLEHLDLFDDGCDARKAPPRAR